MRSSSGRARWTIPVILNYELVRVCEWSAHRVGATSARHTRVGPAPTALVHAGRSSRGAASGTVPVARMPKRKLPGYATCLQLMEKHDPELQERGFHLLLPHAGEHVEELIADFASKRHDHGLRCWLLELLGEARDERASPLFTEILRSSSDESFRDWAERGLRKIDTPAARKALFEARERLEHGR